MTRLMRPRSERPVPGETQGEASRRRARNQLADAEWERTSSQRCVTCGYARINVRHETDPATAPEGPDYYADFLDELHEFVQ